MVKKRLKQETKSAENYDINNGNNNSTVSMLSKNSENEKAFILLMKKIFQYDKKDLDFGRYKIINMKKKELDKFFDFDLNYYINQKLANFEFSPHLSVIDVKRELYERLINFFSQYYIDGDFVPKRRYSSEHNYLISYNGEDVYFYWANSDQYYIKTKDRYDNYLFNIGKWKIIFQLINNDGISFSSNQNKKNSHLDKISENCQYNNKLDSQSTFLKRSDNVSFSKKNLIGENKYLIEENKNFLKKNKISISPVSNSSDRFSKISDKHFIILSSIDIKENYFIVINFSRRKLINVEYESIYNLTGYKKINSDIVNKYNLIKIKETLLKKNIPDLFSQYHFIDGKKTDKTKFEWHLSKFTSRSLSDYFIHKDLKGFLEQELEFYIKNQLIDLDNLLSGRDLTIFFKKIMLFRNISRLIISFLAEFENFQKILWEKKKFILSTDYLITLDYIDKKFYIDILKNKRQLEEWYKLNLINYNFKQKNNFIIGDVGYIDKTGDIDEISDFDENDIKFLEANPTLMIDTRFYSEDFKYKLLESIKNIDDKITGILFNSDNFHALNLILTKYSNQIQCCYIDPPYNTDSDDFLFKDSFKHSSWLTMLYDRLILIKKLLKDDGVLFVSIDNNEVFRLYHLLANIFGEQNFVENFLWTKTSTAPSLSKKSRKTTEYVLCFEKKRNNQQYMGELNSSEDAPLINKSNKYRILHFPKEVIKCNLPDGVYIARNYGEIDLLNDAIVENGWIVNELSIKLRSKWTQDKLESEIMKGTIFIVKSEKFSIRYIRKKINTYKPPTNLIKEKFIRPNTPLLNKKNDGIGTNETSNKELQDFGIFFDYPKPVSLVKHLISLNLSEGDYVLDCFAGSGTTGCAILHLIKERKKQYKFILVESGKYFDSILKKRLIKNVFSFDWKNGLPQNNNGLKKQIIKYHKQEQFADTLHNLSTSLSSLNFAFGINNTAKLNVIDESREDLQYLYENKFNSPFIDLNLFPMNSILNLEKLENPFKYIIKIETSKGLLDRKVDLIETFNYLVGIKIKTILKRKYSNITYVIIKGYIDRKRVIIIWRDKMQTFNPMLDRKIILEKILSSEEYDEVFVNGSSLIKGAISLDTIFKLQML